MKILMELLHLPPWELGFLQPGSDTSITWALRSNKEHYFCRRGVLKTKWEWHKSPGSHQIETSWVPQQRPIKHTILLGICVTFELQPEPLLSNNSFYSIFCLEIWTQGKVGERWCYIIEWILFQISCRLEAPEEHWEQPGGVLWILEVLQAPW